jgi:hypothetical protein
MAQALGAAGDRVRYVSILRELCGTRRCRTTTASGVPTQFDYGHLTYEGAAYILSKLKRDGSLVSFDSPQKSRAG